MAAGQYEGDSGQGRGGQGPPAEDCCGSQGAAAALAHPCCQCRYHLPYVAIPSWETSLKRGQQTALGFPMFLQLQSHSFSGLDESFNLLQQKSFDPTGADCTCHIHMVTAMCVMLCATPTRCGDAQRRGLPGRPMHGWTVCLLHSSCSPLSWLRVQMAACRH